ncbi:hypothetical protein VP01_260g1 [Puccinia sorghi]|uniref:Uncharacterized protein n=1 Tax=Puccinia sorghi TaxID=27349 RepID=A0A0L6V4L5_9BASI|nr:hypothetical protein VP01_260g1 [Puccinia sorghi]
MKAQLEHAACQLKACCLSSPHNDKALQNWTQNCNYKYDLQTIVLNVSSVELQFMGCKVFFIETLIYGEPGNFIGTSNDKLDLHIIVFPDSLIKIWVLSRY